MTSEVAFFCVSRSADALKAEKPGPVRSVDEIPSSFVIKPVNWPSTTPTTDNKAGSAREGLISPSIVKLVELELAGRLMLYSKDVWTSAL